MKLRKIFRTVLLTTFVLTCVPCSSVMAEQQTDNVQTDDSDSQSLARAESTGYIYTSVNGVMYKRLWSYSRGCWLEPAWSPA